MNKIKPPELEISLGIGTYMSKTAGIRGKIKTIPEDFVVEEILEDGMVLELNKDYPVDNTIPGQYTVFTLQKNNWDTIRAIKEISKRLHVSEKRLGYAGTKDKRAVTIQKVSVKNVSTEELKKISIKDIKLGNFQYSDSGIELGNLKGNRFTITLRGIEIDSNEIGVRVKKILEESNCMFPNFYGIQRFGTTRPITHLVGKEILRKNFKEAAMIYLSKVFPDESQEAISARRFLSETKNFKESLKRFPKYLKYELAMLNHLVNHDEDFIGALRKLPLRLRMMFIHAYQGYVFNRVLSYCIENDLQVERLPLVGFNTRIDEISARILEEEGISQEDFKVKEIPELSSKGEYRNCFQYFENFDIVEISDDDLNDNRRKIILKFSLNKGSYATTLLREFMKNEYWEDEN